MKIVRPTALALFCLGLLTSTAAFAGVPEVRALLDGKRYAEAEKLAREQMKQADRTDALCLVFADAIEKLDKTPQRESAIEPLEECVRAYPNSAKAKFALAQTLGELVLERGGLFAMRKAGSIGKLLEQAVELEPDYHAARSSLQMFYIAAPSVVGGGLEKAQALTKAAPAAQAAQARVLRAQLAMAEKRLADAERELTGVRAPASDADFADELRLAWRALGSQYAREAQLPKARAIFERMAQEAPQLAGGVYMLARMQHEAGEHEAAVANYERAAKLEGAYREPIAYRIGITQQVKGDKAQARAAFERYLATPPNRHLRKSTFEDAKKRLAELN